MRPRITLSLLLMFVLGYAVATRWQPIAPTITAAAATETAKTPADDYTVHVSAPHLVNGKVMGPFHHWCKVHSPAPVIVCQIYDDTNPNSMMTQVEFILAKKITRNNVSLATWNKLWHDHAVEIATGRVQVHDLPPDNAKQVADLVATTDGIIFAFDMKDKVPLGTVTMAQAVGHRPMSAAEWKKEIAGAGE